LKCVRKCFKFVALFTLQTYITMRKLIVFTLAAGMLLFVSCGQSAKEKAAAEQARLDSIAAAQVEAAKQAVLDSIAQVEEEAALQAKMDSMEQAVKEAEEKAATAVKQAAKPAKAAVEQPKEEPEQAKPTRAGATKRSN